MTTLRPQTRAVTRLIRALDALPAAEPLGPLLDDARMFGTVGEFRGRLLDGRSSVDEVALLIFARAVRRHRAERRAS